jgi:hypothetical protein
MWDVGWEGGRVVGRCGEHCGSRRPCSSSKNGAASKQKGLIVNGIVTSVSDETLNIKIVSK